MIRRNFGFPTGVCLLAGLALTAALSGGSRGVLASPAADGGFRGAQTGQTGRGGDRREQSPTPPGVFPVWKWWTDDDVKKEIGLTDDKVKRIDDIFQDRERQMKPLADDFQKLRAELDRMTAERTADDATYALQVWRFESARAKLSESRTLMLYKISKQLQPDQYKKLLDILARRAQMNGRGRGDGPRR